MYLPPHFAAPGEDDVAAFVDSAGAADLVTYDGSKPVASLIPVIWDRAGAARANEPLAGAPGPPAHPCPSFIVNGR